MILCLDPYQEEQIEAADVPTTRRSNMIFISRENHCRLYNGESQDWGRSVIP